ncbi:MAG: hypothetical protein Q9217_002311 [Psora testacea]
MTPERIDDDHLLQMTDILGKLPDKLLSKWIRSKNYFGPGGERIQKPALEVLSLEDYLIKGKPHDMGGQEADLLLSLLRKLLQYDPANRPSTGEILMHPWFARGHAPYRRSSSIDVSSPTSDTI